jgi:hypothetical protein
MMNDQLQIIIPTRGRKEDQLTVQSLGKEFMHRTTLVCPQKDYGSLRGLREDYNVVVQPDTNWKIAQKREWIIQEWNKRGHNKIIMLDDDLRFATRISDNDWHLRPIGGEELIQEFQRIEDKLGEEFPHVGFGQRQGNNQLAEVGWKIPGKQVCTLGYYLPIVAKEVRWDLVELREDMCATLQLLLKGYPNAVWTETVVDQREFDAPGGCSTYRTVEMSNIEAEKLASLYPQYVSTVTRKYNEKKQGGKKKVSTTRIETIIQWNKALEEGQRVRNSCS